MVSALSAGRGPLPLAVAIGFLLVGPFLLWLSIKTATEDPKPVMLSCTKESADVIACGNVRGPRAIARRETGKNARTCFTLGDQWMNCGGPIDAAVARVNALPVGRRVDVDVTPPKEGAAGMLMGAGLAILMIVLGLRRLIKGA